MAKIFGVVAEHVLDHCESGNQKGDEAEVVLRSLLSSQVLLSKMLGLIGWLRARELRGRRRARIVAGISV